MADDLFALADLLKINDTSLADIDVSDLRNDAPFMSSIMYVPATHGTLHKYTKETGAPVVGFRAANGGRDLDSSEDTEVSATLNILDFTSQIDKAIADAYVRGGASAKVGREARRHLRQAMFVYEKQLLNGTIGGEAAGFVGFANVLDDSDDAMVVDAGGTTANTGSSVYLVRVGEDDVVGVLGNDGVFDLGETVVQQRIVNPGTDNKTLPTYYTPGTGYCGLQVGGAFSFARICNLTEDSGKGLTDDLIYDAMALFPAGRKPNRIVMNVRSEEQLRKSRTATNATGAPAPLPSQTGEKIAGKMDLIITDGITNTEALLTAA